MQTLTESSAHAALESREAFAQALTFAETFTERFAQCKDANPAEREAVLLAVQFPAILQPVEPGDAFAGRIRYGLVGFSPEPGGLGYFCARRFIEPWLKSGAPEQLGIEADALDRLRTVLEFWHGRTTAERVRAAFPPHLQATLPSDAWTEDSGVAFPLYRMAGLTLDFARLLNRGLDGLEADCHGEGPLRAAWRSCLQTLRTSIAHYASELDASAQLDPDGSIRTSLQHVEHGPPDCLRDAIQLLWLYALHAGVWNYGRLDITLSPFLDRDLQSGRLDQAGALDLLCGFWRLLAHYDNQYNNRIIVGGLGRPNEAQADHFARLCIEATRRLRQNQPQLTLRFHQDQSPEVWASAIDAIGEGCTYPMLYNDDVNVPAVAQAFGVDEAIARQYTPFGCGEYVLGPHSVGTPNGVINLLKAVEVALHGGIDPLTNQRLLPLPDTFGSFDAFWQAYTQVVEHFVTAMADFQSLEYRVTNAQAPFLFASLLMDGCLQTNAGALSGKGPLHLGGTLETYGNTNAADSLHAINELVFRQGTLSLNDLRQALSADFKGFDDIRRQCQRVTKYGNDEGTADAMAERVHLHVCTATRAQAQRVGLDSYLVVIINNWANTILGAHTAASPDGRLRGEPLANANNPSPGSDTHGVTAFLNSLARLDPALHAGSVQNMKFSREWFSPQMRPKFEALLATYFANGGTQAMITVVAREDLQAALVEPEKWGHLMVRVGGFSIRFVELPREAQLEILNRTLH